MKNISTIITLVICTVLIIMVVTVPKREDHVVAITQNFKNNVNDDSKVKDVPLFGILLNSYRDSYFEDEMDRRFNVKNYLVLSVGKFDSGAVSVGVFGNVIIGADFMLDKE